MFRAVQSLMQKCFEVLAQITEQCQNSYAAHPKPGVRSKSGAQVDCTDIGSAGVMMMSLTQEAFDVTFFRDGF